MRKRIEDHYLNINKNWTDEAILDYLYEILPTVSDDDYIENLKYIRWLEKSIKNKIAKKRIKLINEILR